MRVIAGRYRSRRLLAPAGEGTRPTSDRLRETLFNVLGPRTEGARFADLYAGTGAVGIEAASRGAREVLFVERSAAALAVLRANLRGLGLLTGVRVEERTVAATLERQAGLGSETQAFDLVFLDPPYEAAEEYLRVLSLLGRVGGQLLREGAWVVAEHASRSPLPEQVGALSRFRVLRQGDASLSFYALPADRGEDEVD